MLKCSHCRFPITGNASRHFGTHSAHSAHSENECLQNLHMEIARLKLIIDEVNSWAVCYCLATPEDMAQSFPRIVEITSISATGDGTC